MSTDIVLPFGKHTGKKLSEVSEAYLLWLSAQKMNGEYALIPGQVKRYLSEHSQSDSKPWPFSVSGLLGHQCIFCHALINGDAFLIRVRMHPHTKICYVHCSCAEQVMMDPDI